MTAKAIVFQTNGVVSTTEVRGHLDIQRATGGYFEAVTSGPGWCLYGNETGRVDMLPMNEPARHWIAKASGVTPSEVMSMHGDMILVGSNRKGETIELDEELIVAAERLQMYDPGEITFTTIDCEMYDLND